MARSLFDLRAQAEESENRTKYVTFLLGAQVYGIESSFVAEILPMRPVTPVPRIPDYVRGVINLRGRIVPIIDVSARLSGGAAAGERQGILVVQDGELTAGMLEDGVLEVTELREGATTPAPPRQDGAPSFVKSYVATPQGTVMLLDAHGLLTGRG